MSINTMRELDVVRDIREALAQRDRGESIPHEEAIAQLRARVEG